LSSSYYKFYYSTVVAVVGVMVPSKESFVHGYFSWVINKEVFLSAIFLLN